MTLRQVQVRLRSLPADSPLHARLRELEEEQAQLREIEETERALAPFATDQEVTDG